MGRAQERGVREELGKAVAILRALERMGIYMLDVHPGNIKFNDGGDP